MSKIHTPEKKNIRVALLLGALSCLPYSCWAEEAAEAELPMFELEEITVEAKRPDWETKLSPGTVTVIKPEEYQGEQKDLPELLKKVPGLHVRELNGKGQYATVTVRGSTASQVGLFIDGVLTNLGGDAAADISAIPIENVERIEVYRGYIPSRFAGTFMGGVINVVTKKPKDTHVALELGKSSWGGKKGSLEVTAPTGKGTLLVGLNYDASKNNFRYKNYASSRAVGDAKDSLKAYELAAQGFVGNMIDALNSSGVASISSADAEHFKQDGAAWESYIKADNGLAQNIRDNAYTASASKSFSELSDYVGGYKQIFLDNGATEANWLQEAQTDWENKGNIYGVFDEAAQQSVRKAYVEGTTDSTISQWQEKANPATNPTYAENQKKIEEYKQKVKQLSSQERWRKYNDYEKSSALVKWQNDKWTVKASHNKMDRHLPDSLWGDDINTVMNYAMVDLKDIYYADSRRQTMTTDELLVQNRFQTGKLEMGWMVDYTHQNKKYRAEHIIDPDNFRFSQTPLRKWSQYLSNKINTQVDGSYKLSENQMLDFQMNYSHERMKINGSLMDKVLDDTLIGGLLGTMRNRYDQDMLNVQLQDSITLDKKGSWILTPALRYNQSKITGYSDGKRFSETQSEKFHWISTKDSQVDGKATWQIALKKQFDDKWTVRTTGGTYYRLLNMYEIAGDGAGILPATHDEGSSSVFPMPEQGKQFDFSVMHSGNFLGADSNTALTYFWRDSKDMLQLERTGLDYSCYYNDNKGKAHGIELSHSMNWRKFDLDIKGTYTDLKLQRRDSAVGYYGYHEVWPTYQPKYEANVRFTFKPTQKLSTFLEMHYTDQYFTFYSKGSGGKDAYLAGKPVSDLMVLNAGIKLQPTKRWQINLGCNDVFNSGPRQKIYSGTYGYGFGYINSEYPLQGRTYYGTVRYSF